MSANAYAEYKEQAIITANATPGMRYDEVRSRFVVLDKAYFPTYLQAKWYLDYIKKFKGFNPLFDYVVNSIIPEYVLDFENEFYAKDSSVSTFAECVTHSRAGNATMVDSDGVLKWAPHNLALNSASPATQSITVVSGAEYTVECTGVSIALSGAGTGTVTEGNPVTVTASTTTLTLTVTGSTGTMWAYRSDLGGMVDNPDTGDSYVPTTSAARYLPRRGHHVWDGSEWVNEGYLHESEARTNLETNSINPSAGTVGNFNVTWAASTETVPAGGTDAYRMLGNTTNSAHYRTFNTNGIPFVFGTTYAYSVWLKPVGAQQYVSLGLAFSAFLDNERFAVFDLVNGTVTFEQTNVSGYIKQYGEWYRCTVVATANVTRVSGNSYYIVLVNSPTNPVATYVGSTSDGVDVFGHQVEEGSTPSSSTPTSGSTVTRAADEEETDELTYDSTAMWFSLEGTETYADEGTAGQETLFDWRADANNRITVTLDTDSAETGEITLTVVSGGTSWSVAADYLSPGINVPFNIAWRVTDSDINLAVGGSAATAVSTTSIPDLSTATATFGGNGTRRLFRAGTGNVGDSGIEEASA